MAVVVVAVAQITGVNAIAWGWFALLFVIASSVILVWLFVFPRMRPTSALRMEQVMIVASIVAVTLLVAVSGGATSPYVFFFALTMIFVASFVERRAERRIQYALATFCAAAPVAYDWDAAVDSRFLPLIAISLAVWWATCGLVALKRRSTVAAELRARELAYVDLLTGAASLRGLESYAAELAERGVGYGLAWVRVDGIGEINRSLGHLAGDDALIRAVGAMRAASIAADQVGRVDAGEFVVILPRADAAAADRWVSRFRERLEIENAMAADGARVGAEAGSTAGRDEPFESLVAAASAAHEEIVDPGAAPVEAGGQAERARRLREQMAAHVTRSANVPTGSVELPTGPALAAMSAAAIAIAIGMTGGAASLLISTPILAVTYFAVFGSRAETIFATLAVLLGVAGTVALDLPMSDMDQTRLLTVFVTVGVAAYTLQSNSRRLTMAERRAAELSLVDVLTGLPNRTAFERELSAIVPQGDAESRADRLEGRPAVIAIDLAGFTATRERIGSVQTDLLLIEVAQLLRDATAEDGRVYRIGGDEYAVILRAHHERHVTDIAAHCADAMTDAAIEFHVGRALWSKGMTAPDLAAAAIVDQDGVSTAPLVV